MEVPFQIRLLLFAQLVEMFNSTGRRKRVENLGEAVKSGRKVFPWFCGQEGKGTSALRKCSGVKGISNILKKR